ncbi:hypothetical protein IB274_14605 [Pseudomonas sp. PDM18]|uniref:hypothetical protein n=1 Tax=Pseudomonas sp. PDM18 TaxID=2769253 RepID=UPI0017861F02|nr:hypothetical protein [Pseudomonas sp. PDM18]MBD9677941.1 hypothetical protein [Pseudomonas sp. PDM18]
MLSRIAFFVLLAFLSESGFASSVSAKEPAGLQALTFNEALTAYHASGEVEAFQCVHIPVGKNNMGLKYENPIAVEFDEKIYVKINGALLGLDRVGSTDKHSSYSSKTTKADVYIRKSKNPSEYGESADRLMTLKVVSAGRTFLLNTFGAACGI